MARKHRTRTIYLGKSVKDLNRPGLDTIKEVEGIAKAIILDYKKRKISYRKAISRLNLLSLVVTKAKSMKGKKRKAKKIINKYREKLMNSKSSRRSRKKTRSRRTKKKSSWWKKLLVAALILPP